MMQSGVQRVVGAAVFAVLFTIVISAAPLLGQGEIDAGRFIISLLSAWLVGYLVWPGIADAWANRNPATDGRRLAWLALGIVAAIVLSQAVTIFAGPNQATWSFVMIFVLLALLATTILIQVRRARRL